MARGQILLKAALAAAALANGVLGDDILQTVGFSNCNQSAEIMVQKVDINYIASNKTVTFDVAGTSSKVQNVTAILNVTAYGQQIYSNTFNPCSQATFVEQLCPVPAGSFAARGDQQIPAQYASLVPSIAFQVPDIAAMATLQLRSLDTGLNVACVQSQVTNGKTANVPAVSYVAAGVASVALVASVVSAAGAVVAGGSAVAGGGSAAAAGGVSAPSPSFGDVVGWFQGMAMNGMLSVSYPQVYRSFSKNFAFSTGLIPWTNLQLSIDSFRAATGGNITKDGVLFLRNATLVFPDGSIQAPANGSAVARRAFEQWVRLSGRDIVTTVNETAGAGTDTTTDPNNAMQSVRVAVQGIQAYVEELSIPSANTFMTVLLIIAIVIAAIAVGILLVKVILEFWALFGSFPKALAGFRKHYWGSIARAITNLILLLYGVWVLYCVFQFTHGDSWAAKTLAGATLFLFTSILIFFSWKIWSTARKLKQAEGDTSGLYEDKSIWVKYSLFYESYRRDYWWIFVPTIIYMFAKGFILAAADGNGMVQTIAQLVIEAIMLILLLWSRPFERRSGNIVNIVIQVVRVLSVVCILVFVEEFGIAQTTQTVAGVVLIAVQSALTGVLALLIAWNAIVACCKQNPHRKRRKEMEKMQLERDVDNLTPLDARNSLLIDRSKSSAGDYVSDSLSIGKTGTPEPKAPFVGVTAARDEPERYLGNSNGAAASFEPANPYGGGLRPAPTGNVYRPLTPASVNGDSEKLIGGAAPMGMAETRQPTLPNLGMGVGYSDRANGGGGGFQPSPRGPSPFGQPPYRANGYQQPYGNGYSRPMY